MFQGQLEASAILSVVGEPTHARGKGGQGDEILVPLGVASAVATGQEVLAARWSRMDKARARPARRR